MALPGITDRNRLPRLGKVRLGEKTEPVGTKKGYPKALPYFSFVDVPELETLFGKECTEMAPILLPNDDEDIFFPTARKSYRTSGLFCSCSDGVTADRVYLGNGPDGKPIDPQGSEALATSGESAEVGERFDMPCPGDDCPFWKKELCKNNGRLFFIVPHAPRFGVYEISTGSYNSIVNVVSATRAVRSMAGTVTGIPFKLTLEPQQAQVAGKGKTIYAIHMEFPGSAIDLARHANRALKGGGAIGGLVDVGEDETPTDLYPFGGAKLDAALGGPQVPAASAGAVVKVEPKRVEKPAPAVQPAKKAPVEVRPEPEPEPKPAPAKVAASAAEPGVPCWVGKVIQVTKKAVSGKDLFAVEGAGGVRLQTTDKAIAEFAEEAMTLRGEVSVTYEQYPSGARRIIEIRATGN